MFYIFKPQSFWDGLVSTTAICMVFFMTVEGLYYVFTERGEPVVVTSTETLNSPIKAGDDLRIRISRIKLRSCPLTSYRQAMDENGHAHHLGTTVGEGGPLGSGDIVVEYPTPVSLPAGKYDLVVRLLYDCPDKSYYVVQPNTKFVVEETK